MSEKDFYGLIAQELNLRAIQVANTVELLDDGNTVPFIARYRKERTGKMDEEQIRAVEERIKYLRMLEERKTTIHLHSTQLISGALFIILALLMLNGTLTQINSLFGQYEFSEWFVLLEERFISLFQR